MQHGGPWPWYGRPARAAPRLSLQPHRPPRTAPPPHRPPHPRPSSALTPHRSALRRPEQSPRAPSLGTPNSWRSAPRAPRRWGPAGGAPPRRCSPRAAPRTCRARRPASGPAARTSSTQSGCPAPPAGSSGPASGTSRARPPGPAGAPASAPGTGPPGHPGRWQHAASWGCPPAKAKGHKGDTGRDHEVRFVCLCAGALRGGWGALSPLGHRSGAPRGRSCADRRRSEWRVSPRGHDSTRAGVVVLCASRPASDVASGVPPPPPPGRRAPTSGAHTPPPSPRMVTCVVSFETTPAQQAAPGPPRTVTCEPSRVVVLVGGTPAQQAAPAVHRNARNACQEPEKWPRAPFTKRYLVWREKGGGQHHPRHACNTGTRCRRPEHQSNGREPRHRTNKKQSNNRVPNRGGGGGDMQVLHMGVLTKFFSPLEKRGSLGGFCTFQTCPLKKGTVFVLNKNQGRKAPRDPHWNV